MGPHTGRGRPRQYCTDCRPAKSVSPQPKAHRPAPQDEEPSDVYAATLAELRSAGRVDTAKGQAALLLAERLVNGADAISGVAAAVKQLRETLDAALTGATVVDDPVDELQARRAAKFA